MTLAQQIAEHGQNGRPGFEGAQASSRDNIASE
jgi:hypothetical protein